jgi:hypothetical protein
MAQYYEDWSVNQIPDGWAKESSGPIMRIFEEPNYHGGFTCPMCQESSNRPVILVPIPGTESDGIVECNQVHYECYVKGKQSAEPAGAPAV